MIAVESAVRSEENEARSVAIDEMSPVSVPKLDAKLFKSVSKVPRSVARVESELKNVEFCELRFET